MEFQSKIQIRDLPWTSFVPMFNTLPSNLVDWTFTLPFRIYRFDSCDWPFPNLMMDVLHLNVLRLLRTTNLLEIKSWLAPLSTKASRRLIETSKKRRCFVSDARRHKGNCKDDEIDDDVCLLRQKRAKCPDLPQFQQRKLSLVLCQVLAERWFFPMESNKSSWWVLTCSNASTNLSVASEGLLAAGFVLEGYLNSNPRAIWIALATVECFDGLTKCERQILIIC